MTNGDGSTQKIKLYSWKQFLAWKKEMLDEYDRAREKAKGKPVQSLHGRAAEAEFRKWLEAFLPKKFGVTSGYIISQRPSDEETLARHFDVIIYDRLESPVLWLESTPDVTEAGTSRAIPAEYVRCVFEIKSSLDSSTATAAIGKLKEMTPLLSDVDEASERYKRYLPKGFFCGAIFFELRDENSRSEAALSNLIPIPHLRGYYGGVVLRGEGLAPEATARISLAQAHQNLESTISAHDGSLLSAFSMSDFIEIGKENYVGSLLSWSQIEFAKFAFDVVALLNGTFDITRISSFHGLPWAGDDQDQKDEEG